jgi:hypothetical protein
MKRISKTMLAVAAVFFASNAMAAESRDENACGEKKTRITDAEFFNPHKLDATRNKADGWRKQNVCKFVLGPKPGARAHSDNLRALMTKKDHDDCLERMNFARRKGSEAVNIEVATLSKDSHRERALAAFGIKLPEARTKGFMKASGEWLVQFGKDFVVDLIPFHDLVFGLGGAVLWDNCTEAQTQINLAGLPFLVAKGGRFFYSVNMRERMAGDSSVVYEALIYEVRVGNETRSIPIWGAILPVHIQ